MAGMIAAMTSMDVVRPHLHRRMTALLTELRAWPWFETVRMLRQRFREDRLSADRQQPDVHDADQAGASDDGDARRVLCLPDVREIPGCRCRSTSLQSPGARQHRAPGDAIVDAVCCQGQQAWAA
jgi:hypothetical protein